MSSKPLDNFDIRRYRIVAMHWLQVPLIVLASVAVYAQESAPPPSASQAASVDANAKDRTAIRAMLESFSKAFEARDAHAVASHWTSHGEYLNSEGVSIRGRKALEDAFAEFFAATPEVTAQAKSASLHFLSADAAVDEGLVTIKRGPTESPTSAQYRAILLRTDGKWELAMLSETAIVEARIEELDWLIGDWKSQVGEDAEIHTTYAWVPNKKFIHVQFTIKEKELALSGHQVIGVDPETGLIHSWTFEADGGIGEADWERDGNHWLLDAAGTLSDGTVITETNILHRIDDNTFTWQSTERRLDEEVLDDLAPVKIQRIQPSK